jgi:hypothetical protein
MKRLTYPCLLLAALIMNDPAYSKTAAPSTTPTTQTNAKDMPQIEGVESEYVSAACSCASAFVKDYGKEGGKWLLTQALANAPLLLNGLCEALVLKACPNEISCPASEAISIEKFMQQHFNQCPVS